MRSSPARKAYQYQISIDFIPFSRETCLIIEKNIPEIEMMNKDMTLNLILHHSQLLLDHKHHNTKELEVHYPTNPTIHTKNNINKSKLDMFLFISTDNTIGSTLI
jgi:hypothetical protein